MSWLRYIFVIYLTFLFICLFSGLFWELRCSLLAAVANPCADAIISLACLSAIQDLFFMANELTKWHSLLLDYSLLAVSRSLATRSLFPAFSLFNFKWVSLQSRPLQPAAPLHLLRNINSLYVHFI